MVINHPMLLFNGIFVLGVTAPMIGKSTAKEVGMWEVQGEEPCGKELQ